MILRTIYTIFFSLLSLTLLLLFAGYAEGPAADQGQGFTGAPGETGQVCGNCHGLTGAYGIVMINAQAMTEYNAVGPNDYQFIVNGSSGFPFGFGFQATVVDADTGTPVSLNYMNVSSNLKVTTLADGRKYVEHDGPSGSNIFFFSFEVDYPTAQDAPDEIAIHYAATTVNTNNMNTGDSGSAGQVINQAKSNFLPVTLSDFKASVANKGIQLDWATETEQDNDYFAVEHSLNGADFKTLEIINGGGDSEKRTAYTYTHTTPVNGNNYYRLRMVDMDGRTKNSHVVVERFSRTFGGVTAFPNPAYTETSIRLTASADESATVEVYDLSGRLIHTDAIRLGEGDNLIDINCSGWIPNHYFIRISGEEFGEELIRVVKK